MPVICLCLTSPLPLCPCSSAGQNWTTEWQLIGDQSGYWKYLGSLNLRSVRAVYVWLIYILLPRGNFQMELRVCYRKVQENLLKHIFLIKY